MERWRERRGVSKFFTIYPQLVICRNSKNKDREEKESVDERNRIKRSES